MNRKPTRQSRSANAEEKRFQSYTKDADCICCGKPGPSIIDHCMGSSFKIKHNLQSVLVGHWLVLPLCLDCDKITTSGSKRAFREAFGSQSVLWARHVENSRFRPSDEVLNAIREWGK